MAEKHRRATGTAGRPDSAPQVDRPEDVRNVVLVGHSGSGKTTLVEALLVAAGAIPRAGRVEDGTTVSDHEEVEHRQGRSVSLSVLPLIHDGIKVNLVDTPGYADFVGEVRAGLRAADAALFVVSAADGVDAGTQLLWEECAAVAMPRAVVITRLDHPRADFDAVVAICQRLFGEGVLPLHLPMGDDDGTPAGLLSLLSLRVVDYRDGGRVVRDPDPEHVELAENSRSALIEGIISESEDESLMDRYVEGDEIPYGVLLADLETAVARGNLHPVLATSATTGLGTRELLALFTTGFPAPAEHPMPAVEAPDGSPVDPLSCDPDGPLLAEVVRTTTDPYVGRLSVVRVFSGTLRPDQVVHVAGHTEPAAGRTAEGAAAAGAADADRDLDERIGALTVPFGRSQRPVSSCVAGDICAVAKLTRAETGDTLSSKDLPLRMEPWLMPDPLLPVAVVAHSRADEDKLSQALSRLVAEDPSTRLETDAETRQLVLWCMGEAHVDVVTDRLRTRHGVEVDLVPVRMSYRETFGSPARGHGRHVKQSGGHGQFAVCDIEVEPLPAGSGFEFVDRVVGGAVPRQFVPSVEKGVLAQMERGVAAGYPLVDIRVTLVDGKAHPVDSSDLAFQTAGGLALRAAAESAEVRLLEPVVHVEVVVADEYVGPVMTDLTTRRGRVVGTEPVGAGRTVVRADVPSAEVTRYALDLRSLSHGTGTFGRRPNGYQPMPSQLAAKLRQG